jgi:branched-subunit amino acid transport protein
MDLHVWLSIAGITLSTFIARSTLLVAGSRLRLPPRVESALRFAPACALAAIVVPDLAYVQGVLQLDLHNARLIAGIVATVFFSLTRSMIGTIGIGMCAFWALRHLAGP